MIQTDNSSRNNKDNRCVLHDVFLEKYQDFLLFLEIQEKVFSVSCDKSFFFFIVVSKL